ncbi:MAG TPA: hypothetical protein VF109_12095, partial [Mycobacteriales bacterium]
MLDTEPTGADGDSTRDAGTPTAESAPPAKTARRRRAPAADVSGDTESPEERPAPRRRARKVAPAAEVDTGSPVPVTADPGGAEPAAPRRSRRRATAPAASPAPEVSGGADSASSPDSVRVAGSAGGA